MRGADDDIFDVPNLHRIGDDGDDGIDGTIEMIIAHGSIDAKEDEEMKRMTVTRRVKWSIIYHHNLFKMVMTSVSFLRQYLMLCFID